MAGIIITGIKSALMDLTDDFHAMRKGVHQTAINVTEDLLRKARDRAPIREGVLVGSGSGRCTDHGYGVGFRIEVGFDTPYALRMHEAHYQARPKSDMVKKTSKKTGKTYWTYAATMKLMGKSTERSGGVRVSTEYRLHQDGFWIDSKGNKHGRKYLTRAWDDNKARYLGAFEAQGDG